MLATRWIKWPEQYDNIGLLFILLLAFFLRLYGLGQVELDDDETYDYHRWVNRSFQTIVIDDMVLNNQSFTHILARASILGLGDKLFTLRWPAVCISVLGVAIIYKIARRLFEKNVGLISALLLAVSPYVIAYAHTYRGYSSIISLTLLVYLLAMLGLQTGKWRYWVGLAVAGVVTLYTHLFTALAIFNLFLLIGWVVIKGAGFKKFSYWQPVLAALLLVGLATLLYAPVWGKAVLSLAETGNIASNTLLWVQQPQVSASLWENLLWFNGLQKGHYGLYGLYPFLGLVFLGFWLGYARGQGQKLIVLIAWVLLPFFEIWLLGQLFTNFWARPQYLGYTLPPLLILTSLAMAYWSAYSPPLKGLLAGIVFSLLTVLLIFWYLTLNEYFSVSANGNWQAVSNFLQKNSRPDDLVVCQQYTQPWQDNLIDPEDSCTRTLNHRRKADIPMISPVQISHQLVYERLLEAQGGAINRSGRVWLVVWDIPAAVNLASIKGEGVTLTEFQSFGRSAVLQVDLPGTYAENLAQALLALRSSVQTQAQRYLYSLMIAPLAAVSGQSSLARQSLALAADNQPDSPKSTAKINATEQLVKTLAASAPQNLLEANFGDEIRLRGYNLSAEIVRPTESITLTLFWEALKSVSQNFTIFLHVRDQEGHTVAQFDFQPFDGQYPMRNWQPGQTISEVRVLPIPANFPPGKYHLLIGLYNPSTLERLPLLPDPSGENALLITSLTAE